MKEDYIYNIYYALKDKIEYDSDVEAISKSLIAIVAFNPTYSLECWAYIIQKYDLKTIQSKIDLTPLIKDYPYEFITKSSFKTLFDTINKFDIEKRYIINDYLFNSFDEYNIFYMYLKNHTKINFKKEICIIKLILHNSINYYKSSFDLTEFLKNIINIHLESNTRSIKELLKICEFQITTKENAILKALLIDYI